MKRLIVFILICIAFFSCAKRNVPTASVPEPKVENYFLHTVKYPGETLAMIAEWYTGSSSNWKIIAKENPNLNPNLIKIGESIKIPRNIVKKFDPLPKSAIVKTPVQKSPSRESVSKVSETSNQMQPKKIGEEQALTEQKKVQNAAVQEPSSGLVQTPLTQSEEERERIRKELLRELLK